MTSRESRVGSDGSRPGTLDIVAHTWEASVGGIVWSRSPNSITRVQQSRRQVTGRSGHGVHTGVPPHHCPVLATCFSSHSSPWITRKDLVNGALNEDSSNETGGRVWGIPRTTRDENRSGQIAVSGT